jgi:hypothetical protein
VRSTVLAAPIVACGGCRRRASPGGYLFVWAGDSAGEANDFLAVFDANPASSCLRALAGGSRHHRPGASARCVDGLVRR